MYDEVAVILERAPSIITDLQNYQGAGEQIREVFRVFLLMRTKVVYDKRKVVYNVVELCLGIVCCVIACFCITAEKSR